MRPPWLLFATLSPVSTEPRKTRFFLLIVYFAALASSSAFAQKAAPRPTPINPLWESFSCTVPKGWYQADSNYTNYTRRMALAYRSQVLAQNPEWAKLPCCPENYESVEEGNIFEALTLSLAGCFHPGAYYEARTSTPFHDFTSYKIGQQCTYTRQGRLISSGVGAGTPDLFSPTVDLERHLLLDVYPWTKLTPEESKTLWPPNPGCNSSIRYRLHPNLWSNLWMYVRKGDVLSFTGAMGRVKFDVEGNDTGPEGSYAMPKTDVGLLGRIVAPNPIPEAAPGALIGAVYQGPFDGNDDYSAIDLADLAGGFVIGRGTVTTIQADGYLLLGINDGFLANNTGWLEVTVQRIRRKSR